MATVLWNLQSPDAPKGQPHYSEHKGEEKRASCKSTPITQGSQTPTNTWNTLQLSETSQAAVLWRQNWELKQDR